MKRLLSVIGGWAEQVRDGLTVWSWKVSDFTSKFISNFWEGLCAAGLVIIVISLLVFSLLWWAAKHLLRLLWLVISKGGRGIGWLWTNHRSWLFSGLTAVAFVVAGVLLYPMIKTSAVVDPQRWLKVAKVIGVIMWGLILLPLLIGLFRRLRLMPVLLGIVVAVILAGLLVAGSWYMYVHKWPLPWLPFGLVLVGGLAWLGWWLFKRRAQAPVPPGTPGGTTPARSSKPACRKRTGPPALVILILIAIDLWVLVTQVMSPGWHWPFFHWSTPTMWLRAWPLWAVLFLTAFTFLADWGEPNRPNGVRTSAANMVSMAFVLGLVIMSVMSLFFVCQHIRW